MKQINICLTYLATIDIEDDEDINEAVLEFVNDNYQSGYNDLEYEEVS